jgi:uncharacterized damage-inducible protein DinB
MSEVERIADQLQRAFAGPAWHGPSLMELLQGVAAAQAAAKPLDGVHSIWEILLHIITWQDVARQRLAGETMRQLSPDEDWPALADAGDTSWQRSLDSLAESTQALHQAILKLPVTRLDEMLPAKSSIYGLLHGVVQHNLYHSGQVALLKKAVRQLQF